MSEAQNLRELQAFVENAAIDRLGGTYVVPESWLEWRSALKRCERHNTRGDILAFINGLDTRLRHLDSATRTLLHQAGIKYACFVLSESSLKHHLRGYFASSRGRLFGYYVSRLLVQSLRSSVEKLRFQGLKHDTKALLQLVTEDSGPDTPSLHQVLYWGRGEVGPNRVGIYLSLLVQLGDNTLRHIIWDRFLYHLATDPKFKDFHSAYVYASSLLDAGDLHGAQTVLKAVSSRAGQTLPKITKCITEYRGLMNLLQNDAMRETISQLVNEDEHGLLLRAELDRIETRLGVKWLPSRELHAGLTNADAAVDQPILTMDGDSLGYESPERFIAELDALRCSSSAESIRRIADLLDEYEGDLIPISIKDWPDPHTKLYWAPHRSPIELRRKSSSERHDSQGQSELDLGLVQVIQSKDNSPFASEPPLRMMQLGYLLAERSSPDDEISGVSSELEEPGYIVTWERASDSCMIVFTGTSRGVIDPATEFQTADAPSGCRTILKIDGLGSRYNLIYRFPKYRLEPDPGQDLSL
ncbi:hypothetical protein BDV06DRAFT_212322 [Aspergillus oleicola]